MKRLSWQLMGTITGILMALQPVVSSAESKLAFQLADSSGEVVVLSSGSDAKLTVVCFLGTECPMAQLYGSRLSKMAQEFQESGVQFVGVNSNVQDSMADIREYVRRYQVEFPMVRDIGNKVADQFQATRTPEVFVLDNSLQVIYHGRIDDQYEPGVRRSKPVREDLKVAITEALAGQPVSTPRTQAPGCLIGRVRDGQPHEDNGITFAEHVAPMLHRHCIECHRDGEIAPFSMEEYDEVAGWADTMLETIDDGRMPPWHADPNHGKFQNARDMPEEDRQILRDWIAGGLPAGDLSKVPEAPEVVAGWQMQREPEMVLEMRDRPFTVAAEGTVEYQYFVVDPGFKEDKWILDARSLPGNREVVHHIIVYIRPPELEDLSGVGWLTSYVPGARPVALPKGRARRVPAGSKFVFQMHYTPTGEEETDLSKLGLIFADEAEVTHEVYTIAGVDQEFEIPPGEDNYEVWSSVRRLPNDAELLGIAPHMHYRGKSFTLWDGDGDDADILLNVPAYDFNWQHVYQLEEPLPLNEIERLRFLVTFDNSDGNPFNPDPETWVTWGDQSWEEMAIGFFDVAVPRGSHGSRDTTVKKSSEDESSRQEKIDSYVDRFFRTLDRNGDGRVARSETPIIVRRRNFDRFDANADGYATRSELISFAEELYPPTNTN